MYCTLYSLGIDESCTDCMIHQVEYSVLTADSAGIDILQYPCITANSLCPVSHQMLGPSGLASL